MINISITLLAILVLSGCAIRKECINQEAFNLSFYKDEYKIYTGEYPVNEHSFKYKKENENSVRVWKSKSSKQIKEFRIWEHTEQYEVLESVSPYYYYKYKLFFPDGRLKAKGIALNPPGLNDRVRIGKWIEFDEKKKRYKQVNYDKKRGKIGFRELLQIVENDNEGVIIDYHSIDYLYDNEKNIWHISYSSGQNVLYYTIDGKSGKILSKKGGFMRL